MEFGGKRGEGKGRRPRLFNYLVGEALRQDRPHPILLFIFPEDGFAAKVVVC